MARRQFRDHVPPLPRDETSFFGRSEEIAEIARRRAAGARLITLVGPGGVGKTRLALASATSAERVAFAALGQARSLEASVREVARACGLPTKPESNAESALAALARALAGPGSGVDLLVLDNTEQLGPIGGEIADALLDAGPALMILATSREPIGARGEEKIVVAPLTEPDAVALLHDRARAAVGRPVDIEDADALALVRRVDQLPLAIELAASRLEILSVPDLLTRLARRLDVLADSSHRTLTATLDWSWELLSAAEQSALVQASVFAGPFDVHAAEEVIALDGVEVLTALEGLVKRSLVQRLPVDDRVRLGLFQTVRAWARGKLEGDAATRRHAIHHLEEAERAAASTYGEGAALALDRLAELLPELLAAFEAVVATDPAIATRIVLALSDLLLFRGLFELRAEVFEAGAKAAARTGDDRLLARALVAHARVMLERGRMSDAAAALREALELSSRAGDEVTRAEATRSLGWALVALGPRDEADRVIAEAMQMHERQGSARGLADAHAARGILRSLEGNSADALADLRRALSLHVEHGDVVRQEKVLGFGQLVGHDAREIARGLPRDVLARAPRASLEDLPADVAELVQREGAAGQRWRQAVALYRRGASADERGEADAALGFFDRALEALARAGIARGVAAVHAHAAATLASAGDRAEAEARLERARAASADNPLDGVLVSLFAAAMDVMNGGERRGARELLERVRRGEVGTTEVGIAARVLARTLAASRLASCPTRARVRALDDTGDHPAHGPAALVVGPESRWMMPPRGERIDLVRYGPARRVLDRLVTARLTDRGAALSPDDLIAAGWPGERMRHSAGLLRVYSVVRRLRRLGLEPLLVTRDDGYLLDPDATVEREGV
jgi:predicted ATPase